jgi:glycosyltransferase involved in cell wall biosynthesis/Tfp pilus assembly protein PilF
MSKTRYLIVHRDRPFDPLGVHSGAEMATLYLARYLAKLGNEVILCVYLKNSSEIVDQGVQFWDIGSNYNLQAIFERVAKLGEYHLLSSGLALPLIIAQNDKQCLSRCLISHDRAGGDSGVDARTLSSIADYVFCVSEAQRQVFLNAGLDPQKAIVIHNGVDLEVFKPGKIEERNFKRIVFVGALVVDKGLHLLLQSFASLKSKHPDLLLDVYGDASLWHRDEYINPQEIEKQVPGVKFHGKVKQDEVAKAFATAGLCVVPSIWFDPFPLVSIDAQACGCPVIVSDVGGLKEGVEHGSTGLVIKENNEQALTFAIDSLISYPQKLKEMSLNALKSARARFTWDKLVERVEGYCKLAATTRINSITEVKNDEQNFNIGVVSTWNQECGLAKFAGDLFAHFNADKLHVFAENTDKRRIGADQYFVTRCWNENSVDFTKIEKIVDEKNIKILFLNFHTHHRIWPQPQTKGFMHALRTKGVKIVACIHNTFTLDTSLQNFLSEVDQVITLTSEMRLEAIANGADPEKTISINCGVNSFAVSESEREKTREGLGIKSSEKILLGFGFVQPHKGFEALLEAVLYLSRKNINARAVIAGTAAPGDAHSVEYLSQLQSLAVQHGISEKVTFLNAFLSDQDLDKYLIASDLVVMNYQTKHYEASAACTRALGAGAVVATSIAPAFQSFSDAVWHMTSGYPPSIAVELLLNNSVIRNELKNKAKEYCERNSWKNVAKDFKGIFNRILCEQEKVNNKETLVEIVQNNNTKKLQSSPLRVLMQNRKNAFQQRGGDSIVMEKLKASLEKRGVSVTIDLDDKEDCRNYDIVHLFNFVLPDLVKYYGEKAQQAKVPFVITTLYEDISCFHNQSVTVAKHLIDYVKNGQNRSWYETNRINLDQVPVSANFDNTWAVKNAAALLVTGEVEGKTLRRDYKECADIKVVPMAYDLGAEGNAEDFVKEYGFKDFILCVGRLESRKNQLMLLKALEDVDIPVVFAGGGFSYQPDYEQAVRNFKRKGKTIVLGRITPHMLASAYRAARVHVLPSWYELPGIVSLEAAYYGCNVVVTEAGTARDHFGDTAFYCDPWSEASILQTVLEAYYSPKKEGLREVAMKNTWDNVADNVREVYQQALSTQTTQNDIPSVQVFDLDTGVTEFQEILERGELAAKARDFVAAHQHLEKAESLNPQSVRMLRARGAVYLAESKVSQAKEYFERGLSLDSKESRLYSGLGMCLIQEKQYEAAYQNFIKALSLTPTELVAILQLVECSYNLNKFDDLEKVLRRYLDENSSDLEIRYCLAGCIYKQGRLDEAEGIANDILKHSNQHLGAKQLISVIAEQRAKVTSIPPVIEQEVKASPVKRSEIIIQPQIKAMDNFDAIDIRISELEEKKRQKKYQDVAKDCLRIKQAEKLSTQQLEKVDLLLAEIEVLEGDIAKAETQYDEILQKNGNCARGLCGKGAIAAHRRDWQAAKGFFEHALTVRSGYDVALAGLGLCAYAAQDFDHAWDHFMKATEANPENVRALLGLIELGYPLKRLTQVENALKVYLEMHPVDLEFMYALAGCYFAQDKLSEAVSEVEKICLFQPDNKKALELKDMIRERGGLQASNL